MARPPTTWHEFVGQRRAVLRIRRQLEGAQARGEAFPHLLLCGPSGMGKTRLAMAIATEYRTNLHDLPSHLSLKETVEQLIEMRAFDIAFFDEAHNLKPPVQEVFFGVIDRLLIPNLNQEDDSNESSLQMLSIEPCTLIFATDQPGQLRNALLKRVPLHEQLAPYTDSELREIVNRMARALTGR